MQICITYHDKTHTLDLPGHQIDAGGFIQCITHSTLPRDVREALIVRLGDAHPVTMFGRTVIDRVTLEAQHGLTRRSMQVHPYAWGPAGASNVLVYQNHFHELSVALVYNQRRDNRPADDPLRAKGVPHDYRVPEGYKDSKLCEGGEDGFTIIPRDNMDEAEELVLKKIPVEQAYTRVAEKQRNQRATGLVTHGYDKSLRDCAVREAKEEVGMIFPLNQAQFVDISDSNVIAGIYMIKAQGVGHLPPRLKPDGIEIAYAAWVAVKAFKLTISDNKLVISAPYISDEGDVYDVPMSIIYALLVGKGVQFYRNQEIKTISTVDEVPMFSCRENVEAKINHILRSKKLNPENITLTSVLGASPESYLKHMPMTLIPGEDVNEKERNLRVLSGFGKQAEKYHKHLTTVARIFSLAPPDKVYDAKELILIVKTYNDLDENMASSKVHSCMLKK